MTAAAIILLVASIFAGLVGLVLLILVILNSNPATLPDYVDAAPAGFAGVAALLGLVMTAYGAAGVVAGIQAWRRRSWARGIGIVLAAVGVAALVVALIRPGETTATPLIFAPVIAALAYAAVALATEGRWFSEFPPESELR